MAKKHQKTNAMRILDSKKIEYNMYTYEVVVKDNNGKVLFKGSSSSNIVIK